MSDKFRPHTPPARDTIQIARDLLPEDQMAGLVEALTRGGHKCALFSGQHGVRVALADPRTNLLIVGAGEGELPPLVESLKSVSADDLHVPVLVYFKQGPPAGGLGALFDGVDDFLLPPLNLEDLLLRVARLAGRMTQPTSEAAEVRRSLLAYFGMRQFIGESPAFLAMLQKIPRIADCDATALLLGNTGTGKEMCARSIHYLSTRADNPFIPVNCGSIPSDLFENEMFGHEPGAYTDARRPKRGMVAEAEGGTLFLDEVDSLPLSAQVKLLRFLQDRQYRPLGATHFRHANVRLIAASNQNLARRVTEGSFREDLYYRLKVVLLSLPDLRDRREDIVPLAMHFLRAAAGSYRRRVSRLSQGAVQKLLAYEWPGNVRELENVIHQAVVLSRGQVLGAGEIVFEGRDGVVPAPILSREPFKVAKARVIEDFERAYLSELLAACDGNISQAARDARKDRRAFFALLKKYNLTMPYHRQAEADQA